MMNSSFLLLGPFLLGTACLLGTALLLWRHGPPLDTPRSMGVLLSASLAALWLAQGVAAFGLFPVFWYPSVYGVLLGIIALTLPGFTYLGVVDHPSQIQRKLLWRLPVVGAVLGHFLHGEAMFTLALVGWVASLYITWRAEPGQRHVARLGTFQAMAGLIAWCCWRWDLPWGCLAASAAWACAFHGQVEAFLAKNLLRPLVAPVSGGT